MRLGMPIAVFLPPRRGRLLLREEASRVWTLGLALLLAVILYVLVCLVDAGQIDIASAFGVTTTSIYRGPQLAHTWIGIFLHRGTSLGIAGLPRLPAGVDGGAVFAVLAFYILGL
jgi:hypothetical protein